MSGLVTWSQYRRSIGDRSAMFDLLAGAFSVSRALYVGSYVDLSPSTAIPHVTYVDIDSRARRFFEDEALVQAELAGRGRVAHPTVRFIAGDYTRPIDVADASVDLLISLFTVPAWDTAQRYLRPGGALLANTSHGEAGLAALNPELRLAGVIQHRSGRYRLVREGLEGYLVPRRAADATADHLRRTGRGIAYTRSAFAYVFTRR